MQTLARFLQLAGLTLPPIAMSLQLMEQIKTGEMLKFLLFSVGLFTLGYLLQRFRGGSSS